MAIFVCLFGWLVQHQSDFEREKQIAAARMEKYHDKLTWAEESRQKALELFEEVGGNMDKLPLRKYCSLS